MYAVLKFFSPILFFFFQRALFYFGGKIFFCRTEVGSRLEVFCKKGVLCILQSSSENTCIGVFSLSKVIE